MIDKPEIIRRAIHALIIGADSRYGIPQEIAVKTLAFMLRVLEEQTRQLYNDKISTADFENRLLSLIDQQLTRAWNEGMRANGLDPTSDNIPEWRDVLEKAKLNEIDYIEDFGAAIAESASRDTTDGKPSASLPGLLSRAGLWANRYNDIVNLAIVTTAEPREKYEWQLGATEEHCGTCNELNGIVASADVWRAAGVRPQNPPNPLLECGGWRCRCQLVRTDKRQTKGAANRIAAIVAANRKR